MDHDLCRAVVHRDLRALVAILDGTPGLDLARRICPGRSRIRSPLEWAIEEIDPDAFAILVRYGAKAESVWDLRVQMYDLVKTGASGEGLGLDLVRLVRAVLAHEPQAANRWTLIYALQRAARLDRDELVLAILDARPDLADDPVMIHIAARQRCGEPVFCRLVDLCPHNVTALVYDGFTTPLHTAVGTCSWPVVEILLRAVPDIREVPMVRGLMGSGGGGSVFHRLCARGDVDLFVRFLRAAHVSTTDPVFLAPDPAGRTPWTCAEGELAAHLPSLAPSRTEALQTLVAVAEYLLPDLADIVVAFLSLAQHTGLVPDL
jgi:hypothetical protein